MPFLILTSRPDYMSQEDYKLHLKIQKQYINNPKFRASYDADVETMAEHFARQTAKNKKLNEGLKRDESISFVPEQNKSE